MDYLKIIHFHILTYSGLIQNPFKIIIELVKILE